jgi:hypothetical protein
MLAWRPTIAGCGYQMARGPNVYARSIFPLRGISIFFMYGLGLVGEAVSWTS